MGDDRAGKGRSSARNRNAPGWFLTFEGVEAAGKSTQARLLAQALEARGVTVLLTREPGGTALGAAIRELLLGVRRESDLAPVPLAELFLILADRAQHVANVIRPALASGRVVVADRFADATLAYQAGGRGIDPILVERAIAGATGGLVPDQTVLLDLPVATARRRLAGRHGSDPLDRLEAEEDAFHERVREAYRELARREPGRIKIVDAEADPEAVHRNILSHVLEALAASGFPVPSPAGATFGGNKGPSGTRSAGGHSS